MKKLAILSLVLFTLISCSKKKIHCSEVEFAKDFMKCKYSGASYTGDVWSDDEKTAIMTFEDGLLTEFKMFENGQVAINIILVL